MAFYDDLRSVANDLIAEFGGAATLETAGTNAGTAWEPETRPPVETPVTVVDQWTRRYREGTLIPAPVHTVLVSAAAGVVPQEGDRLKMHDVWHEIAAVRPVQPAPDQGALLYEVDVNP